MIAEPVVIITVFVIMVLMINSFSCSKTQQLFETGKATGFLRAIKKLAKRKLSMLHLAKNIDDLRIPPGNHLEMLSGDRLGQFSRIKFFVHKKLYPRKHSCK